MALPVQLVIVVEATLVGVVNVIFNFRRLTFHDFNYYQAQAQLAWLALIPSRTPTRNPKSVRSKPELTE